MRYFSVSVFIINITLAAIIVAITQRDNMYIPYFLSPFISLTIMQKRSIKKHVKAPKKTTTQKYTNITLSFFYIVVTWLYENIILNNFILQVFTKFYFLTKKNMLEKIRNLIFKISDYDDLYFENERQKKEIDNLNIYIQHLEVNLNETKNELNDKEESIAFLKGKINNIDLPKSSLSELEKKLILADNFTLKLIIDYLTLDSFELVKNIASRVNKDNFAEFVAYRDWALWRNEELKKILLKHTSKKETFTDRITWEEEDKRKKPLS